MLDSDGDGSGNRAEYAAGTDPLDAASSLGISSFVRGEGSLTLSWRSVPGRSYAIEESDDLSSWRSVAGGAVMSGGVATGRSIPENGAPSRFLRVRALP